MADESVQRRSAAIAVLPVTRTSGDKANSELLGQYDGFVGWSPGGFWFAGVLLILAAWSPLDKIPLPGVRSILRRRVNRVVNGIDTQLDLKIQAFKPTRREVPIDRLTYDPDVMRAMPKK